MFTSPRARPSNRRARVASAIGDDSCNRRPARGSAVDALTIEFTDALVQSARGQIWPREAQLNEDTRFTYTLWPSTDGQDSGFDRLRFHIPGATTDNVAVRIGGE